MPTRASPRLAGIEDPLDHAGSTAQLEHPTPTARRCWRPGWPARAPATSGAHSPPSRPSPPAFDTAAASAPPADPPIGADTIGFRTRASSVNAVAAPSSPFPRSGLSTIRRPAACPGPARASLGLAGHAWEFVDRGGLPPSWPMTGRHWEHGTTPGSSSPGRRRTGDLLRLRNVIVRRARPVPVRVPLLPWPRR